MNVNSELDRGRLFRAMQWSYKQLEPFRNLVYGLVQEYAGSSYGQPHRIRRKRETIANLMNQTIDAYTMSLVASRPRVSAAAREATRRSFAKRFQIAMNNLAAEIQLEKTLRRAVLDAFFLMGIVRVHLRESAQVVLEEDLVINPATPFVSNVALDNFVFDMAATKYSAVDYAGDWYRIPFSALKEDMFDQKVVKQLDLQPTTKARNTEDARLERIAKGEETDQDELEPMIDLCDVWIRRDRMIYTFPIDPKQPFGAATKAIGDVPWENPQYGPYPILTFAEVPENVVSSSPASHLWAMARDINAIMRKQARRARAQRTIGTYTPAGKKDAESLQGAADMEWKAVADMSEIKIVNFGGVDQGLQAYQLGLMQLFDRMAGNLPAKAGLAPQAGTASQEEVIQGAVSRAEAKMQEAVADFAVTVVRMLGFMLWDDVSMLIPATQSEPGFEDYEPMDVTWSPNHREGEFFDYDLQIDVHSMSYQSPQAKLQTLLGLVQNVFLPAGPLLAQQGGQINYQKIAEVAADLLDLPQLKELITFGAMPPEEGTGQPQNRMPGSSTREYVRRNAPSGGTGPGRALSQEQAWLGAGQQAQPAIQTVGEGA
jgi:hypothetical protein